MTDRVSSQRRFTARHPCPVCGGHSGLPKGRKIRCHGFLSGDGRYAHCARAEHAGGLELEPESSTFAHRLDGSCRCGRRHAEGTFSSNGKPTHAPRRRVIRTRRFQIRDGDGVVLAILVRDDCDDGGKCLWWESPDGTYGLKGRRVETLPLYGVHEIGDAQGIIIVEGVTARDAVAPLARELGFAVVGTVTGAGGTKRPSDDVLRALPDVPIVIWPDSDEPGRAHMEAIAGALQGIGRPASGVSRIVWPAARLGEGDDAADFVANGGSREDLERLIAAAEPWQPLPREKAASRERGVGVLACDVSPERVSWLWSGRLAAGKLTMLDGDPGLGKSGLSLEIAARISRGEALPGGQAGAPRGVVVLSAEDGPADTIVPRLLACGADTGRIYIMTGVRADSGSEDVVSIPANLDAVEETIRAHDAALVVVDPLMAYLGGETNAHRDQDVRRALAPLAAVLDRTGAAALVIRHLNKSAGGNPIYRGGGSIGIIGAARIGLLVAKDPEDDQSRILAPLKNNLGPVPPALRFWLEAVGDAMRVVWDARPVSIDAAGLLAAAAGDEEECSAIEEAAAWLADLLSAGPRAAEEVLQSARREGFAEMTVRRAKRRLGVESLREGFGPGSRLLWFLPDRAPHAERGAVSIDDQSLRDDHLAASDDLLWQNLRNSAETDAAIQGQFSIDDQPFGVDHLWSDDDLAGGEREIV